jgi:hypothetical protein
MAKHVLYNASVVLNSVDLSDHVDSVSFVVTINGRRPRRWPTPKTIRCPARAWSATSR